MSLFSLPDFLKGIKTLRYTLHRVRLEFSLPDFLKGIKTDGGGNDEREQTRSPSPIS